MSDDIFGEIVDAADVKAAIRPVEVRYALLGEKVRTAKNIAYMANAYAEKLGIKPVKENILFQAIFDQAVTGLFEPTQDVYITLSNGKPWKLSFVGKTMEGFNESVEAFRAKQEGGEKPRGAKDQEEELEPEGDAHKQAELLAGEEGQNPSSSEESEEEEEDVLARLQRELAQ